MMVWLTGVGANAWRQDNSGRNDHPPLGRVIISSPAPTYVGRQTNRCRQGRPDAPRRGNEPPFHPSFQRQDVGVRTKHTTAAERLSSIEITARVEGGFPVRWVPTRNGAIRARPQFG